MTSFLLFVRNQSHRASPDWLDHGHHLSAIFKGFRQPSNRVDVSSQKGKQGSLWRKSVERSDKTHFTNISFFEKKTKEDDCDLGEIGVGREEYVFWFQIAVDNVLAVQVLQGHQDLEQQHDEC